MKRLICLVLDHRWGGWGDNGCYTIHDDPKWADYHDHLMTRFCARCGRVQTRFETRA